MKLPLPTCRPASALLLAFLVAAALPSTARASSYAFGSDDTDKFEFALVEADDERGSTISVTSRSLESIERLKDQEPGAFFWFTLDGRSYLVREPATVEEAMRITAPMRELGRKQGKLGAKQGALGARQGEIGGQQGALGARQGALGARLAALAMNAAYDGDSKATRTRREKIEEEMEDLGRQIEELSRRMEPLNAEQEILAEQQSALGRQQESASRKAIAELRRLAERARKDGRAQRVED